MNLYLGDSLKIAIETLPFLLLKALVYFVLTIGFFIIAGLFLFIASLFSGAIVFLILLIGIFAVWGFFKLARRYVLYLIKAGHIAVITELATTGKTMHGGEMIKYGFSKVKSRFVTASVFFAVDELISVVVKGITNFINRIGRWVPIDSFRKLFEIIAKIIDLFLGYIDEAVLSYVFTRPDTENVWKSSKDGVVLYFKAWKPLLISSIILVLISYIFTFFLFVVFYLLTIPISMFLPVLFKDIPFIIALIIAWLIKKALIDQFVLVMMIVSYHKSISGLTPDLGAEAELEKLVPKFSQFKSRVASTQQEKV